MSAREIINRRVVLASRPVGAPTAANFRLEDVPAPVPSPGQILLRTLFLSLDPYMRGRMSDAPSYAAPVPVGDVMVGGTVSRVEMSLHPGFKAGDLVLGYCGWQQYALSDGKGLTKLDTLMTRPSLALGVLGMPGFTAYMGLLEIGQPKAGETVVVAAASGAVGAVVGQIARLMGCHVVGIAGGPDKCRYVVDRTGIRRVHRSSQRRFPAASGSKRARRASMSISRASAARCSTQCCRCSMPARAFRCAD